MKRSQRVAVSLAAAAIATGGVIASGMLAKRHDAAKNSTPDVQQIGQTVLVDPTADGQGASTVRIEGSGKLYPAPAFTLIDQTGKPFGTEQLKGKTWIAMLFFTECKAACPMMAGRMHDIQDTLNSPDIDLVSITVDPVRDTPDVLAAYAKRYNADGKRWFFLTGTPADVFKTADGLHLNAEGPMPGSPAGHSEKFLLIDKSGDVRGIYSTNDDASMRQLALDAKALSGT